MGKFCPNCGNELLDGAAFCGKCGAAVNNANGTVNQTIINNNYSTPNPTIPERNIVLCILLSFLTCGLYGLYWLIVMTDESNLLSDEKTASGGMTILFTILTCGIYSFYWNYKMGQKLANAGRKYNKPIADNGVLYLVLALFGLSIVNYCLIQSDLNRFSK